MLIDRGDKKDESSSKFFYIMRHMIMLERKVTGSANNMSSGDDNSMKAYEKVTVCSN